MLPDKHAETVAKAFDQFWLQWAGVPEKIVYDNGSDIRLIADAGQAAGGARTCPSDIDATAYNLIGDALAVYENDPNCFVFNYACFGGWRCCSGKAKNS